MLEMDLVKRRNSAAGVRLSRRDETADATRGWSTTWTVMVML